MRETANSSNLPIYVYGPDLHMTSVIPMALGLTPIVEDDEKVNLSASAQIAQMYEHKGKPYGVLNYFLSDLFRQQK